MAKFEFRLPDIGEGVTEGEIVGWLVKVGDVLTEDQEMVEVMTDKATVTIGSPKAGRVVALGGKVGDVVAVGATLVVYELGGAAGGGAEAAAAPPEPAKPSPKKDEGPAASAVGDIKEDLPGMSAATSVGAAPVPSASVAEPPADAYFEAQPLAAPATRKLARELGLDLRRVRPSGPGGRVTPEDVRRAKDSGVSAAAPVVASPAAPSAPRAAAPSAAVSTAPTASPVAAPSPARAPSAGDEVVPLRGLRKRIYENMARSKHTAAHFTYVDEVDGGALRELRERMKPLADKAGVKLSFLPFIIKAAVAALRAHPALNCVVDDANQTMVLKKSYDIGVAAATDAGLIVPVIRHAERLSILDIARELARLAEAARLGKTRAEDLGGSSFTITSLGKQGGLFATPIVNYPEVAILGVHELKRRPVVRGDQIVIGEVMLLSLSFDHRIIDGHVGAAFAQEIIRLLQEPDSLFLEMT